MKTNMESVKAFVEYQLANVADGDYILQAQILSDMFPYGW